MNIGNVNWGSVADWVSGLGTIFAVVVALYLSKEGQRIRLTGRAGISFLVGNGMPAQKIFAFSVTNVGARTTIVTNIGMRVGFFKKQYAIIPHGFSINSSPVPCQLADGESAYWHIPLDGEKTWLNDLCNDFVSTRMNVMTLQFQIHTSNGGYISLKPSSSLRKELMSIIKNS
jgi:hypothetical protein